MRTYVVCIVMVVCLGILAGCQSVSLPREVKKDTIELGKSAGFPTKTDVSLGTITVSTPKFTPLVSSPAEKNSLNLSKFKDSDKLLELIRQSNMGASSISYDSLSVGMALALAGTQVSSSNTTALSSGAGLNLDLGKALAQLLSSGTISASDPPVSGNVDASVKTDASYTRSFKSPETPSAATQSSVPSSVMDKMVSLLSASGKSYTLNPFDTIHLMAQLHADVVNTEAFYNFDGYFNTAYFGSGPDTSDGSVWAPYRMQFTVAVNPGWFTYKNHLDAVAQIMLPEDGDVKIMAVVPQESAQTIDELTSAMNEFKMALELTGGFKAAAVNASMQKVSALAERLEGPCKNTLHLVTYPDERSARIYIRPTRVPQKEKDILQPTSLLMTAYVLVKQYTSDMDKTAPLNGKTDEEKKACGKREDIGTAPNKPGNDATVSIRMSPSPSPRPMRAQLLNEYDELNKSFKEFQEEEPSAKTIEEFQCIKKEAERILGEANRLSESGEIARTDADIVEKGAKTVLTTLAETIPGQEDKTITILNGMYLNKTLPIKYTGSFVHSAYLDKCSAFHRADLENAYKVTDTTLKAMLPPYRPFERKPFGFVDQPAGFYVDAKKDASTTTRSCYIAYSISNPPTGFNAPPVKVEYRAVGGKDWGWNTFEDHYNNPPSSPSLTGIICLEPYTVSTAAIERVNAEAAAQAKKEAAANGAAASSAAAQAKAPERIMLQIRRTNARGEEEAEVTTVVLTAKDAPVEPSKGSGESKTATVDINANGLSGKAIPVDKVSAPLAAIATGGDVELKAVESKTAISGASGGTTAKP